MGRWSSACFLGGEGCRKVIISLLPCLEVKLFRIGETKPPRKPRIALGRNLLSPPWREP